MDLCITKHTLFEGSAAQSVGPDPQKLAKACDLMRQGSRIWLDHSSGAPRVVDHSETPRFVSPGIANSGKPEVWHGPDTLTAARALHLWGLGNTTIWLQKYGFAWVLVTFAKSQFCRPPLSN